MDTLNIDIGIPFFASGYSTGGTSKWFVYSPALRERLDIAITENRELSDIYRERHNDTILYKPIKGNRYIELVHDN
jgi:hypothetical protein